MQKSERVNFGSKIGAVLAAAGSAVGLGNIWRFPYETGNHGDFLINHFMKALFVTNYRRTVCPPGITLISPSTRIQISIAFGLYTRSPSSVNLRFFAAFI